LISSGSYVQAEVARESAGALLHLREKCWCCPTEKSYIFIYAPTYQPYCLAVFTHETTNQVEVAYWWKFNTYILQS